MQKSRALLVFVSILGLGGLAATGCNGGSTSPSGEVSGGAAAQPASQPAAAPSQPAAPAQPAASAQPAATPPVDELAPVETDPRKADLALLCQTLRACWQEDQASGRCHGDMLHERLRALAIKLPENRDLRDLLIASGAKGPPVDELGKQLQQHGVACHLDMPGTPAQGTAPASGTAPAPEGTPAQEATPPAQGATPPPAP
jgi:hypothetical protein